MRALLVSVREWLGAELLYWSGRSVRAVSRAIVKRRIARIHQQLRREVKHL